MVMCHRPTVARHQGDGDVLIALAVSEEVYEFPSAWRLELAPLPLVAELSTLELAWLRLS
jgi:hypothetical protein